MLDRAAPVSLVIYDLAGRAVARLVDGELAAGRHLVTWQPRALPSGTYINRKWPRARPGATDLEAQCLTSRSLSPHQRDLPRLHPPRRHQAAQVHTRRQRAAAVVAAGPDRRVGAGSERAVD